MASTIKVNTLDTQTGTELALAATKKITGDNTQFKITGGSSGDVLTTNGSGVLSWGGMAGFAGVHADITSGSSVYTVPTGTTKLVVYLTGAGGGGAGGDTTTGQGSGGGGAGTVIARVTVVAADTITIALGAGGAGGAQSTAGTIGGDSTFTHTTGTGSFDTITGPGGLAGVTSGRNGDPVAPTIGASNEGIAIKGGRGDNQSSGNSFWGQGGIKGSHSSWSAYDADPYGAGGGGGTYSTGLFNGGTGAVGACFIMEFK
jgi:hypothetical protein